ncbi:hypothetical protein ABZ477_18030 [Microbacterium sp. NPDC019599]|uniref:hypothetical protein n=1 Tax=Microbacterium sp. NPDC019599 TaxID=3154690 RepID=UPI0033CF866C
MEQARQEAGPLWWVPRRATRRVIFDWWPAQADLAAFPRAHNCLFLLLRIKLVRDTRARA